MHRIKLYGILFLVALAGVVVFQNVGAVEVRFLVWNFAMSQVLLLPLVLLIGFLIGYLVCSFRRRHGAHGD